LSTILKALKRIDHTTPPPEDLQSRPLRIDTKETLKARVFKIWLYRKLYLSLILLVAVVAAGWLAYSQKDLILSKLPLGSASEKVPIYQAKINPNSNPSEHRAEKSTATSGRQDIQINANAAKHPAEADRSTKPLPQVPSRQKKPILSTPDKTGSSGQTPTAKPEIFQTQMSDSQKAVEHAPLQSPTAATEKAQARPTQELRSYRRLDDDKLKLQAIAWSKEAAQRIAVINGHVVREGESVEGFSVNQIRREDVIVNDGTESWQLEFSLK
jgi:Type II secretion system protein B